MRIAITGTGGRVGAALARGLAGHHEITAFTRASMDLADPDRLSRVLDSLNCDVFIHPAGITGLEPCEDEPEMAERVNVRAPEVIANWAAARGVRMIHFSTDYVLGGASPGFHEESEAPEPLSVYGRGKLAGERVVLSHPGNLVLRVSWVFGPEKPSFIDKVLESALAGKPLEAVADKFSLPTFTGDLVGWVRELLDSDASGVMHACNSGEPVSWHGMAEEVLGQAVGLGILGTKPGVAPQKLDEAAAFRATRPRHTAMATGRLTAAIGHPPRHWKLALADYLAGVVRHPAQDCGGLPG
jgi:dTDP-4-dehydrorhamnose reductase